MTSRQERPSADVSIVVAEVLHAVLPPEDARRALADPTAADLWDSLLQIEILFTLEQELDVRFSPQQMRGATSAAALTCLVVEVAPESASKAGE